MIALELERTKEFNTFPEGKCTEAKARIGKNIVGFPAMPDGAYFPADGKKG
jgi:hypothetical protein